MKVSLVKYRAAPKQTFVKTRALHTLLAVVILLACASNAMAEKQCFSKTMDMMASLAAIGGDNEDRHYLLGLDSLLTTVTVKFFEDGRVCGVGMFPSIRFEGTNQKDGEIHLSFLANPQDPGSASSAEPITTELEGPENRVARKLSDLGLSGDAKKQPTDDLIIWSGKLKAAAGSGYDFYLKRTRASVSKPVSSSQGHCGDGGCTELLVEVIVDKNFLVTLQHDVKNIAVTKSRSRKLLSRVNHL